MEEWINKAYYLVRKHYQKTQSFL